MKSSSKLGFMDRWLNWRSFTSQYFLIALLPLAILLLVVAFGSLALHYEAMRSMVGDRDLRAVQVASNSLSQQIFHRIEIVRILAHSIDDQAALDAHTAGSAELQTSFDGGLALFAPDGRLLASSNNADYWKNFSEWLKNLPEAQKNGKAVFSPAILLHDNGPFYVIVREITNQGNFLVGASTVPAMIQSALPGVSDPSHVTTLVIEPQSQQVIYQVGGVDSSEHLDTHPGIADALKGESGIDYYNTPQGSEHVVAFSPIAEVGWALIIEEPWEHIASPYLRTTQAAPLVLVPLLVLALAALWIGTRQIVQPLQALEQQTVELSKGNFSAIQHPVGGIHEIRTLQTGLSEMAGELRAAQENLHSYIGAITNGIESERHNLARELHDDTIQALIALNQHLQLVLLKTKDPVEQNMLTDLQNMVGQTIQNLRRIIRGLRPIYLEDLGLVTALKMLVQETQTPGLDIHFQVNGNERRIETRLEMALYRISQEAISNITHHAQASHGWLVFTFTPDAVDLIIRDNGKGFERPTRPDGFAQKGHFGLLGIQERAELVGSHLKIDSAPQTGTTITVHLDVGETGAVEVP